MLSRIIENYAQVIEKKDESIWLPQKPMAQLYALSRPTINEHIKGNTFLRCGAAFV